MLSFFQKMLEKIAPAMETIPSAAYVSMFIAVIIAAFFIGRALGVLTERGRTHSQLLKGRKDAVKRSRAVLGGQMAEQIAPFLPEFPCNPADVRFIGKPVDFIAFPGMAEGRKIEEIVLIEVKTGSSQLSEREKELKAAVENGKVRYVEYRT